MRRAVVVAAVLAGAPAHADVDWSKGLVTADGVGVADRHAPSPAVARGTSRRGAEDQARRTLAAEVAKLPVAGGGKVPADKIEKIVAGAFASAAEPETDGAWRVTMAVPIEAVRQAIAGARTLGKDGDGSPPVVVVDGVTAKPAVGWKIGGESVATIWVDDVPAWAKDAPHVKAKSAKAGAIEVDRMTGGAGTLYVIRYKP